MAQSEEPRKSLKLSQSKNFVDDTPNFSDQIKQLYSIEKRAQENWKEKQLLTTKLINDINPKIDQEYKVSKKDKSKKKKKKS